MQFTKLSRNLLCFLLVLYYLQGLVYPIGTIISQTCLMLIFVISGLYFVRALLLENKNGLFYNTWTLLLLLNIIGFIFTADFSNSYHTSLFKGILGCMMLFYPFYYFAREDHLKANYLIVIFLIMLLINIFRFYMNESQILMERNSDKTNVVNNVAYAFVRLLPFVFLIKKKRILTGALVALIITFIIQGAKRGAIIAGAIGLIMYLYYQITTVERQNRVRDYFVIIIIMFALSAYVYKTYTNNEFAITRMTSISEGNYSNRDVIYKGIINKWYNCENDWNFFFGFGFAGSLNLTENEYFAHDDWLELLSNFGLIGVCLYLVLFYAAFKKILSNDWMKDKRILMLTITMMWFFITLVSMWYTNFEGNIQVILLAYLIGSNSKSLE